MGRMLELRRVVITGLGPITSAGNGKNDFFNNLLEGKNGIGYIDSMDTSKFQVKIAGEVKNFDPNDYMSKKEVIKTDRFSQFAIAATKLAIEDAQISAPFGDVESEGVGVIIGSGIGGLLTIEEQYEVYSSLGPSKISPRLIPSIISNIPSGLIAIKINARGANFGIVSACASSLHCIGESLIKIRHGYANMMITGGTEASISILGLGGFTNMKALSNNNEPEKASRPFDVKRDGFVMSEGSGILVLEELEHAKKRGAKIYAELIGYGANCDAYDIVHPSPNGTGAANCIRLALQDAGIEPEKIKYVNAHGTSTPLNDYGETLALKEVFGEHAYNLFVSSTKSMAGHSLGAAGAVESIATALSIYEDKIHPTRNYENPDPKCDLNYTPKMIETNVQYALKNSFGFGGHNSTLIFAKYRP